jgi:16S rRNA (uracil1498-N3)-methyltransferase
MRLTRVFVPQALRAGVEVTLPPQASEHVLRVLRLARGDAVTVFDGRGGEHAATITGIAKSGMTVAVGDHRAIERESPLDLTLLQSISRGEKMDLTIQKATELGVRRIVPVEAERSVVQLDESSRPRKRRHWLGVAIAACEQCGRNRIPEIEMPQDILALLGSFGADGDRGDPGDAEARLLLSPAGSESLAGAVRERSRILLLVGPEGGLSEREEELAMRRGFVACRFGPRILRTETAAIAALAALQAIAGDLGR